jgi:hypothetical protein
MLRRDVTGMFYSGAGTSPDEARSEWGKLLQVKDGTGSLR